MNESIEQRSRARRFAPLIMAMLLGIALATFAGLSSDDDETSYVAPAPEADRLAEIDREVTLLATPTHPELRLDQAVAPSVEVAGRSVDLRVLLLVHGADADADAADQIRRTMDVIGVAYDVIHVEVEELTEARLRDGTRGRYNGVILTDAELLDGDGASGLTPDEWSVLHSYTRDFAVREAVLSGFPGSARRSYDYGMAGAEVVEGSSARWTSAGAQVFASVAGDESVEVTGAALASTPRGDASPMVEPLLVQESDGRTLISLLRYRDGREVLLSTVAMGESHAHSYALVYDFVVFATSGLFLGTARTHLAVHIDDLFLDYTAWDSEADAPTGTRTRNTPADIEAVVAHQELLAADHETLPTFAVDFPFNGAGATLPGDDSSGPDALTDAVVAERDRLRFLNHTFEHRDLDVSAGAGAGETRADLLRNRVVWDLLDLPGADENASVVVTGEHSGVWDDPRDGDPADQVPFPEGLNTAMAAALEQEGIRYLAGDASEGSQAADQQVPGFDMVLLPRFPTGLLLNATDPDQQVDQYNWFFHDRHLEAGDDPCQIPAATCERVDYDEFLADEAIATVRHLLSFRRWPHYFHMANVVDYDGVGSTLLGDWLDAVMAEYERRSSLPIENLTFAEIGRRTEADLEARAAGPVGVLDIDAGEVVIVAGRDIELGVTGLADGEPYGGVTQRTVAVGPQPTRFAVG